MRFLTTVKNLMILGFLMMNLSFTDTLCRQMTGTTCSLCHGAYYDST